MKLQKLTILTAGAVVELWRSISDQRSKKCATKRKSTIITPEIHTLIDAVY